MRKPFLALLPLILSAAYAADDVQFNRDIRPIIAENCFHCHGPDPGTRKAGLRLDTSSARDPSGLRGPQWRPDNRTDADDFVGTHPDGL